MRYAVGFALLLAGCQPVAAPADAPAPDAPRVWEYCPPTCWPRCDGATLTVSCGSSAECDGCVALCDTPDLYDASAPLPDTVECGTLTSPPSASRCGDDIGRFDRGTCLRPVF